MLAKPGPALAAGTPRLERIAAEGRARLTALATPARPAARPRADPRRPSPAASLVPSARWRARRGVEPDAARWLAKRRGVGTPAAGRRRREAIERSLAVGAGLVPPDVAWALGHAWRALYPAIVAQLGGDGLADDRLAGVPAAGARRWSGSRSGPRRVNAAKLLALVDARARRSRRYLRGGAIARATAARSCSSKRGSEPIDVAVDAVLPGPGGRRARRPAGRSRRARHARVAPRPPRARCHCRTAVPRPRRRAHPRPVRDRAADRGLGDRQRHAQPHAPPARRSLGGERRAAMPRAPARARATSVSEQAAPA